VRLLTAEWNVIHFDILPGKYLIIQKVRLHEQPVEISRKQVFPVLYDGKLWVYPVSMFLVVGNWDRIMRSLANPL
jgi:hypothetical protein